MARTKTVPRRWAKSGKNIYVIKRLANLKSVRFRNTQFTVRYEKIGKKHVRK